jgi:hypothetical protein
MGRVKRFMDSHKLPDRDTELFRLAAILAQKPESFQDLENRIMRLELDPQLLRPLDEDEIRHLQNEIDNKWIQPRQLYNTIFICSVGAAVQWVTANEMHSLQLTSAQRLGPDRIKRRQSPVSRCLLYIY